MDFNKNRSQFVIYKHRAHHIYIITLSAILLKNTGITANTKKILSSSYSRKGSSLDSYSLYLPNVAILLTETAFLTE